MLVFYFLGDKGLSFFIGFFYLSDIFLYLNKYSGKFSGRDDTNSSTF